MNATSKGPFDALKVDRQAISELSALLDKFNASGIGRLSVVLADLAEIGLANLKTGKQQTIKPVVEDPLYSPAKAAAYLDISPRTLVHSWADRYNIKSSGEGKNRRYALSELNRVKGIIQDASEGGAV